MRLPNEAEMKFVGRCITILVGLAAVIAALGVPNLLGLLSVVAAVYGLVALIAWAWL